jgi:hypothetical protein
LARGNEPVFLIKGAHGTFDRLEVLYDNGSTPGESVAAEVEEELEEAGAHILDMKDISALFTDR